MNFKQIIQNLDQPAYESLKTAVEIGKWPNGELLTEEQKALSLQAVIAYEIEHNFADEQRTGFVDTVNSSCHSQSKPTGLKWQ